MDLRPYLGSSERKIWQTIKPQGPNLPAEELQARMFSELLLGETKNFSLILAFWSILRAAGARSKYSPALPIPIHIPVSFRSHQEPSPKSKN